MRTIRRIGIIDGAMGLYIDTELGTQVLPLRFEKEYMALSSDNAKESPQRQKQVSRCNSNNESKK